MKRAPLLTAVLLLASCGGNKLNVDGDDAGGPRGAAGRGPVVPGDLPCDVDRILEQGCRKCHGAQPLFGAPMPLVTYDDLMQPARSNTARKVFELVPERVAADKDPMPPAPNARLGADDRAALAAWAAAGGPPRAGACGAVDGGGGSAGSSALPGPLACDPDLALVPTATWSMPQQTTDEYVCFGVDVPVATKKQAIAFRAKVQNAKIVHHMLLFQTPSTVSPQHAPCSAGGGTGWRIMYGWAPGGQNLTLPPEAGFPLEGTSHFAVQIHYSNIQKVAGETDTSGFEACTTTELRPNDADVLAFGTVRINVPIRGTFDRTCDFTVPSGVGDFHVVAALPHMHQIGKAIETNLLPASGGAPVDLGRVPSWNFSNQLWFGVNALVKAGDKVRTRCAWDNPTSTAVRFGERTQDEMCYSFTMYYPRITTAAWRWDAPALTSTCADTTK